jgi:hypothetical protein
VCGKALAAEPGDRYATARALAEEVQRWLADEPVGAYWEPLAERLRRWGRRNRGVVSGGVVLLLAGVAGLSVGLWAVGREKARTEEALGQAQANLTRALEAEGQANANLARAEANLVLARRAVDECFNVAKEHPLFQQPRMEKAKKLVPPAQRRAASPCGPGWGRRHPLSPFPAPPRAGRLSACRCRLLNPDLYKGKMDT